MAVLKMDWRRIAFACLCAAAMIVLAATAPHAQATTHAADLCDMKAAKKLSAEEVRAEGLEEKREAYKKDAHLNRVYGQAPSEVIVIACQDLDGYLIDRRYDKVTNTKLDSYTVYVNLEILRFYKPK